MPGTPSTPSSPGGYTTGQQGYGSGRAIAIGAAAAAGAGIGIGYFVLHNRGKMVGCLERSGNGEITFVDDKDKKTYAVISGGSAPLKPGERVALKGKKIKESSGKLAFEVHELKKDYGSCLTTARR